MSRTIRPHEIGHTRGRQGQHFEHSVWVYDPGDYVLVKGQLTAEQVKAAFPELIRGNVILYELDQLQGLNFVLHDALEGGVNESTSASIRT